MWTPESLIIIGLTFFIAGSVKGVIGLGLPTVALALLTATYGLKPAMALLLIPSLVTNVWQGVVGGAFIDLMRRLWSMLLLICVATWFGVHVLAMADTALLSALLGGLLCVYAGLSLARVTVPGPGRSEPWISPVIGAVNGVLTGMTGSFVVPSVIYLQALGLAARRFRPGDGDRVLRIDAGAGGVARRSAVSLDGARRRVRPCHRPGDYRHGVRAKNPAAPVGSGLPAGVLLRRADPRASTSWGGRFSCPPDPGGRRGNITA